VKEVHSLGIFFSYDTDYVVQKNFSDKLKAFKRILDLWSQRDLSLIGKVTILKSLAFSMITYQCCSLNVPDEFLETVNSLAFKFLWSGKPNKIKSKTIIADYTKGGLRMLDIKSFSSAQKVMWVKRLVKSKPASWKAYPEHVLNTLLGMNSFKTQLQTKVNRTNISPFYWNIIKEWTNVIKIQPDNMDVFDIRRQRLWQNKYIQINKQEVKWKNWLDQGIHIIHDLVTQQGDFLSLAEIETKYNLKGNFLTYNSLKDAIPKTWRVKLKTINVAENAINNQELPYIEINKKKVNLQMITNKLIYWKLVNEICVQPVTKDKWIKELKLDKDKWDSYFEIPKIIRDTKIRAFQYKVLFNLTPCNLYLFTIKRRVNFTCNFCNAIDNIIHYFFTCNETALFWSSLEKWWNNMENDNLKIDKTMAMLGVLEGKDIDKLNAVLLLARWYIYSEKQNAHNPFLYKFLCQLKYKIKIERMICSRSGSLDFFNKIWAEIEENLE
jgi:hypothetical protein